ncbi:PAS domain-containing protein [Nocardioides pocheonensis]|uniref:Circadian input-output histidine kinase CikA n=1 Tax=Nocardioides pocheonensis TaxID=661485 RepID=A0A3N0GVG3_9ACTN|nr:PAS domain-containing protein [Nocardioides pocheonensis]RNM16138.1 PAS domain S-box protein [Nocardioides pocheonensis]
MATNGDIQRQIVESSLDGLWVVDAQGRTVYANRRVGELLGRTDEEVAALGVVDVLDDQERACYEAHLADLREAEPDRRGAERTFLRPDGSPVPLVVKEQALYDESGDFVGYLHHLTDDTRRRALIDELSRSRSQLGEAQAIARVGSWEMRTDDPDHSTCSDEMYRVLDVDPEVYVPGMAAFLGQLVEEDRDKVVANYQLALADSQQHTLDVRAVMRDGSTRWVRTVGRVLEWSADGAPLRLGGTVQDIDELKRTELRLVDALQLNTLMQFMATAANETSTLDEALVRLRELLLADDHWVRGVAFDVDGEGLAWRRLGADDDCRPTSAEATVAARALSEGHDFVVEEDLEPDRLVVGFPVVVEGVTTCVVTITAHAGLPHRPVLQSLAAQVAGQLAQVAAREQLVLELTRSRSQLAEAQAIARLGSWDIRLEPYEVTWSDQLYEVLGVDRETFVPGLEEFVELVVESDRTLVTDAWEQIALEPGERTVDVRVLRPDGQERWVRVVGQLVERAADGSPLRFGGTVQDIDALKQAELQLLDAVDLNTIMQFMASAANETSTLDEALGRTRQLLLAHPDWDRGVAFDVSGRELTHRQVGADDVFRPSALEIAVAERVLQQDDVVFEEHAVPARPLVGFPVRLDGATILVVVLTNVSPFVRHQMMRSLLSQVAGQLAQVASREAAAAELAAARDLAMAASKAKSEFLATMSHEIRTPLNGVIGLNDLLLRSDLDPHQRQLAEAMQGAGRSLLVLISDILDFSKIEAGGLELEAVAFQPAIVVQATTELFEPMAAAKGIDLEVEIDDDVPERLEGDPSRFGQVLSNLVANAVKFTHDGGVHVRVSAGIEDRTVTLRVAVRDTGIGMDEEQLGRIFQPFRQADASTTRNFGGTGLGLAIAHRLAAALGGRVGVASVPGEGSTFWFTGKFELASASPRVTARPARIAQDDRPGGHVLVVEDNEVNQLVAVGMLEVLGYTSEVAADGAAAAARAAGGRFDAVLMDLQMPRLDGYAATRLIRQAEPPGVHVPIIALTASATSGEKERCFAAGMTGFLSKPVGAEALGRLLREQLGGTAPDVAVEPAPAPAPAPVVEVLPPPEADDALPDLDTARLDELAEMGPAALPLIQRAIDNFVSSAAENMEQLRESLSESDAPALRAAAHRLKGSAANLGALRVADTAYVVEQLAEADDLLSAAPVIARLAGALTDACVELRAYRLEAAGPMDTAYSA